MSYAIIDLPTDHPVKAIVKATCPEAYDTIKFDRKGRADGSALHHEFYDYTDDAAIICIRRTEGNKYGVATKSKKYYLLEEIAGQPTRTSLEGHNIAALANKLELGQVVTRMMADKRVVRRKLVDGVVIVMAAGTKRKLTAPRGWQWKKDSNGLCLVKNSDSKADYHPMVSELISMTTKELAVKALARAEKRRTEEQKAREELNLSKLEANEQTRLIAKAEREGSTVCLVDSLKAGNCKAGTLNFIERHNLNPSKHYKPSQLLKIANGSADRVKLAVYVALRRHRKELQQGFATLADHYVWAAA